jgi:hypothetical protein
VNAGISAPTDTPSDAQIVRVSNQTIAQLSNPMTYLYVRTSAICQTSKKSGWISQIRPIGSPVLPYSVKRDASVNTAPYLGCGQRRMLAERALSQVYDVDIVVVFEGETFQTTNSNLGLILGITIACSLFVVVYATYRMRSDRNKKIIGNKVHVPNPLNRVPVAVPWTNSEPWSLREAMRETREQFQPLHIRGRGQA